jgi:hypothetical protein
MRLVAASCVGLGIVNVIGLVIYGMTVPEAQANEPLQLMIGLGSAQLGIILVGIALFRFHKTGWIAYWLLGPSSLALVAKLVEWHYTKLGEIQSVPFFIGIEQALWFVPSAICLLLPSSRRCYFNIPDQLWMHQKVLRHGEATLGDISGRPRKPAGIAVLAWLAIVVAGWIFFTAMLNLAEPAGFNPEEPDADTVAGWKVFASVCIVIASTGLMKYKLWGWYAMFGCAIAGMLIAGGLEHYGTKGGLAAQFHVTIEGFVMCLIWCGCAIIYLLLPVTRHAFFSRRRSMRRRQSMEETDRG